MQYCLIISEPSSKQGELNNSHTGQLLTRSKHRQLHLSFAHAEKGLGTSLCADLHTRLGTHSKAVLKQLA